MEGEEKRMGGGKYGGRNRGWDEGKGGKEVWRQGINMKEGERGRGREGEQPQEMRERREARRHR